MNTHRTAGRAAIAVATAGALIALLPGLAHAATIKVTGDTTIGYTAAAGEQNQVTITKTSSGMTLEDTGATIKTGAGCVRVSASKARCTLAKITRVTLDLGDLGDLIISAGTIPLTVNGGDGGDRLLGGPRADQLNGGPGNDVLEGGLGADLLRGGADVDAVTYVDHDAAVAITAHIDGRADSGAANERDTIATSVENLVGHDGTDTLIGSDGPNVLAALDGDFDQLRGMGGDDTLLQTLTPGTAGLFSANAVTDLSGGDGHDTVSYAMRPGHLYITLDDQPNDGYSVYIPLAGWYSEEDNVHADVERVVGGDGKDEIDGSDHADELLGGPAADTINGHGGSDTLAGGDGSDVLWGDVGNDVLLGGLGSDDFYGGDGYDECSLGGAGSDGGVIYDCEMVRR